MSYVVVANLDAEASWVGITLPLAVRQRISTMGALCAVLAGDREDVEVYTPLGIDVSRIVSPLLKATFCAGSPKKAVDLHWAKPAARPYNDRRFALPLRANFATVVTSIEMLDEQVATMGTSWVAKAVLTAAGRDRYLGNGALVDPEGRTRVRRLIETHGALVVEPWLQRTMDYGVCGMILDGSIVIHTPHGNVIDTRGNFVGIDLEPVALLDIERRTLDETAMKAGVALRDAGYTGAFAIDAFVYEQFGARRFHPLCEINARYTFGWIARSLRERRRFRRLGFGAAPEGATILIAPADGDPTTAWLA